MTGRSRVRLGGIALAALVTLTAQAAPATTPPPTGPTRHRRLARS